jgi:hypothetical protein
MNLIERWAQTQDLGPLTQTKRLAVTFDQSRVHLIELPTQQLLLEARVCDLPVQASERERTLERVLTIALARSRASSSHVMVDSDASAFWLQRCLPAGADVPDLDLAVEGLVNDIELWRTAL